MFQVQAPGGLIFGGAIQRRVFALPAWGGLYLEGLIHGGAFFRNFTVPARKGKKKQTSKKTSDSEVLICIESLRPGSIVGKRGE